MTASEETAGVGATPATAGGESVRVTEARTRAKRRLRSQRDTLRPLGLAVIAVVAVGTFNGHPRPAWNGNGLVVALALAVFAVQEALTNVARYAPGASTSVVLRYESGRVMLTVENRGPDPGTAGDGLPGVGGGRGLKGMRNRIEQVGGAVHAGPTNEGWRVELEVPA